MDNHEGYRLRLKGRHTAFRRLGVRNIRCLCGETDPVAFEADHIYRRVLDDTCWGLCKNCHAKRTARGNTEHPPVPPERPDPPRPFLRFGHMLLGVCDYLSFIVDHLRLLAEVLFRLDAAGVIPPE